MSEQDSGADFPPFDPQTPVRMTNRLEHLSNRKRKLNQYVRGEKIGQGKHGDVYLCRDENNDGYGLALKAVKRTNPRDKIKLLRKQYQTDNPGGNLAMNSTMNAIRREIAIMKKCRHANLVRLVEVIDDERDDKIYMVMEYLSGGPVEWANADHKPILLLQQIRRIMRDTILGLEYLHREGIIHRDIKPANILYTHDRHSVKLIDFGVAHFVPPSKGKQPMLATELIDAALFPRDDLRKRVGTPSFLAPEVVWHPDTGPTISPSPSYDSFSPGSRSTDSNLTGNTVPVPRHRPPITKAIDVWSLGVTFYCLLFGRTPFTVPASDNENIHHNEFVLYNQICTVDWNVDEYIGADCLVAEGRHPRSKTSEASAIIHLLDQMLQKNPKNRISLADIKSNPWMTRDVEKPKDWLKLTSADSEASSSLASWVKTAGVKFMKLLPNNR